MLFRSEVIVPRMSAEEVVKTTKLPDGFRIQAIASEPDVQQPIAMTWDTLGRLWIAENYTYAESAKRVDMNLSDRIVILEDTNLDGTFDKRTVFADEVKGITSIEFGTLQGVYGVYVLAPPTLTFIADDDLDGQREGKIGRAHV